ncbi:EamA-like transporter family protein [mine drainage metagenome]|jgi:drug/metabolite transporter (DMT)-like permease|uniref:EamA-like transporter family protein n=1 Tax=mine drainage metagenome TaxID=410659 RepID=A0A1J5QNE9_9ZZZZ
MARDVRLGAIAALLLNATVWGLSWWPLRALHAAGVDALWSTALSYALCAAAVVAARPQALAQLRRAPQLLGIALASGATNAAFNLGVTLGDVVRVVLLFYLMPVWAMLLARVLLGERAGRAGVWRLLLGLAGALCVLWPGGSTWPWPQGAGDWLGLIGGAAFALNNVLLRKHARQPAAARALAMFGGGPLVAGTLAVALTAAGVVAAPPAPGPWIGAVALFGAVLLGANLGLQYGAARLPANLTALVMNAEIVVAASSAIALGVSTPTARAAVGGSLIVFAVLLAARAGAGEADGGVDAPNAVGVDALRRGRR